MKDRSDGSRNDSSPIGTRAADSARGAKTDPQVGRPFDAAAPRARQQERRGPANTRRQRTGHAADETADAWMFRPGDEPLPRSGYGEQGFGAGEGEDGRWGGGRRGGYGGGQPGGDHGTRGGGWSAARQRHEMGRGPRSFGPDGWGPSRPASEWKEAAPEPWPERNTPKPSSERKDVASPAPARERAGPESAQRDQLDPGDT